MHDLVQDLRFALRAVAKAPGFTAAAASCIALGIAAAVFVMSPVNAILLRPLPYAEPERLVHLSTWSTEGARRTHGSWSYPDYVDLTESRDVFSAVGVHAEGSWNVGGGDEPERMQGARVSASLFPLLGLRPALGRFMRADEESDGRVVVLGYGVWERKFGADSTIVGRAIPIDGVPHTVIGIMERGVRVPEIQDLWLPLVPGDHRGLRDRRIYQASARLAPGVSVAQADARLAAFMAALEGRHGSTNARVSGWVVPMNDLVAREVRPIFLVMLGAVGFVLLIACANVANLLLARGASREREVAVRLTMGASRFRIVRQLVTESLVLAVLGGAFGILLGTWGVELFVTRMLPTTVPYWMRFDIDATVLGVSVATILATALLFGIAPALQLSQPSLTETLKAAGGRGSSSGAGAGRTRSTLVVAEIALSMVLLMGAGLMMRSFLSTQRAALGFDTRDLLTFQLALSGDRYANDTARASFFRALREGLSGVPGVVSVGMTNQLPIAACCLHQPYFPEGKEYPPAGGPVTYTSRVSPSFLHTMRIPLLAGRPFEEGESRTGARVVIVDSVLARREWPGESALGRQLRLGTAETEPYTVVGIIPHIVTRRVQEIVTPEAFVPLAEDHRGSVWVALRTDRDPATQMAPVREVVRALDPDLPLARLATMDFHVRERMFEPRVYGSMFSVFAIAALLLATIGLYGVMSYVVSLRVRELGVRMALGADSRSVLRLVMGSGVKLIAAALAIGFPASIALAQLLRRALYGVTPTDPLTLAFVPALLAAVALAATFVPARRATRVDPMVALRNE